MTGAGSGATNSCEIALAAVGFVNKWRWASDLYEIVRADPNFERFSRSGVTAPATNAAAPLHHSRFPPAPPPAARGGRYVDSPAGMAGPRRSGPRWPPHQPNDAPQP